MPSYKDLKILIVDDTNENIFVLSALLKKNNFLFDTASSGKQALEMLLKKEYGLVLLDVQMPDMDGFEVASYLKNNNRTKHIPIIFVSALATNKDFYKKGLSLGAVDYIVKPFDSDLFILKINNMLQLAYTEKKLNQSKTSIEKLNRELKQIAIQNKFSFNAMFYNSADLILVLNKQGVIVDCNQEYINFGDLPSRQIIGNKFTEIPFPLTFLNTEYSPEKNLMLAFSKKENTNDNILVKVENTKLGTLYYELNFILIKSETGEDLMLIVLKNITEKKQAEIDLIKTKDELQLIFDTVNSGIVMFDENGIIRFANLKMANMLGVKHNELISTSYYNYVSPSEKDDAITKINEVVTGKINIRDIERKLVRNDGTEFWCHLKGTRIINNSDGTFKAIIGIFTDITERKVAEEKLKQERIFFKKVLDAFPHGIYIVNKNYEIEYINPVAIDMFGKQKSNICYKHFHNFDSPCSFCKNEFVFKGEKVTWYHETANKEMYLELVDIPLKNNDGSISKLEIIHDITEKHNAENRLRKSEEKYRNLFEEINEGILVSSPIGEIEMANTALCNILGYNKQELVGKIGYNFLLPKEEKIRLQQKLELRKKGKNETYETKMLKKNGDEIWVQISASPIYFDSGSFYGVMSFISDITKVKEASLKLIENEKFVRGVFNSMSSHIAVLDKDGTILITNNAWKNFASQNGLPLERTDEGTNYFDVCRKSMNNGDYIAGKVLKGLRSILQNKSKNFQIEYPCHSPNIKRWFLLSANLFDGSETRIVIRHINITERKEQQSRIANAAVQSQELEKEYLAREIHDNFGQKLMALKLYYNSLESHIIDNENSKELINNIKEITNNTIQEARNLSHSLVMPEFADFGFFDAVAAIVKQLNAVSSIQYKIKKMGEEVQLPYIIKINLYRAIQEFLNNSQKYSKAETIKVYITFKNEYIELFLCDDGIGFDIEKSKKSKKGIGVLNIIHRLESINATFEYISSKEKGTQLLATIYLD